MELDDLKNNWEILNKSVNKQAAINEKIIRRLIAEKAIQAKEKLVSNELFGIFTLASIWIVHLLLDVYRHRIPTLPTIIMMVIILIVIVWQLIKARFLSRLKRIETDTVHYLRQINRYAYWIKIELHTSPLLGIVVLVCLYYQDPFPLDAYIVTVLVFLFLFVCILTVFLTQKTHIKHIKKIKEAIEELEEIEQAGAES